MPPYPTNVMKHCFTNETFDIGMSVYIVVGFSFFFFCANISLDRIRQQPY